MKEVREFESAAAKIWLSQTSVADKQEKMDELAKTIEHYIVRCKQALMRQGEGSEFQRRYIERAITHLDTLAKDCREVSGITSTQQRTSSSKTASSHGVVQPRS
jgi:hypothetical protein